MTRDSIEWAYCILHQKLQVYKFSNIPSQMDDIEYLVAQYAMEMDRDVYAAVSGGRKDFLMDHGSFASDLESAVAKLEELLGTV